VESEAFALVSGAVIIANTVVIGLECQDIKNEEWKPTYRFLEALFGVAYAVELALKLWLIGFWMFFFPPSPAERGWNRFDFLVTVVGGLDVLCDQILNVHTNASALRLLRVLRVMRIFRIVRFLRDVEYTFLSALGSVVRVVVLVLMIDYIGAVVITHILHDTDDEVVSEMFGKLSSSMFFLFEVMVDGMGAVHVSETSEAPGGLVIITHKVMQSHPNMWIFWVAFVFIGTISLMALVPAITVELNLQDAERQKEALHKDAWELRVETQRHVLEKIFEKVDIDRSNSISREEVGAFLSRKDVLRQLGLDQYDADEYDDVHKVDLNQLRMEFTRVYDALESEGRSDLGVEDFIDAFRQMRVKPLDQTVLTLQQEIFNLRTIMTQENSKIQGRLDDQLEVIKCLRDETARRR